MKACLDCIQLRLQRRPMFGGEPATVLRSQRNPLVAEGEQGALFRSGTIHSDVIAAAKGCKWIDGRGRTGARKLSSSLDAATHRTTRAGAGMARA